MTLRHRLSHLEREARQRGSNAHDDHLDEEGWLAVLEELGREGLFAHEPDFPGALAKYRLADRIHSLGLASFRKVIP